jgi:hypothetical protein
VSPRPADLSRPHEERCVNPRVTSLSAIGLAVAGPADPIPGRGGPEPASGRGPHADPPSSCAAKPLVDVAEEVGPAVTAMNGTLVARRLPSS